MESLAQPGVFLLERICCFRHRSAQIDVAANLAAPLVEREGADAELACDLGYGPAAIDQSDGMLAEDLIELLPCGTGRSGRCGRRLNGVLFWESISFS